MLDLPDLALLATRHCPIHAVLELGYVVRLTQARQFMRHHELGGAQWWNNWLPIDVRS